MKCFTVGQHWFGGIFIHCKDKSVPCNGLFYLAGAVRAIQCSTDFKACWQSEHNLSRNPRHVLLQPHSCADAAAASILLLPQHHYYYYLSTATWTYVHMSWKNHYSLLRWHRCTHVPWFKKLVLFPVSHTNAHSMKTFNITSALMVCIHQLGTADPYDAWALEMEVARRSSEQSHFST